MPPTLAPPEIDTPVAPSAPQRISFADYLRQYDSIDPIRRQVAFYVRGEDGRYQTAQGRVASRILPGFVLDPGWLWHDLLPGGAEIYRMALAMADEGG
jgi:Uma2 family endonuclease